jgi:hypothetical protein
LLAGAVMSVLSLAAPDARALVEPPVWLKDAAKAAPQAMPPSVPAAVLIHDERITIESDGRIVTSVSHAARVLTRAGRAAADATEVYRTDTGRVRQLHGWMIPATGAVREYADRDVADLAMVNNDLYNEARVKRINAIGDAQPGSVFGYESQTEDRAIFTQFEYAFQYGLPTQLSRFSITVPAGWRVESVTFNHATIRPTVNGSTYTWQLDNLPQIEDEPASQELSSLVARIGVNVFPPSGARAASSVTFGSWQEVSKWLSELSDPQVVLSNDLVAKAKALTVTASTNYDRIAAIGRFVQGITYVSIQTGIGRGGGYKPHTSAEVFTKAYGDCKDKANLMRAMLKAVGITSYPVAIYSGDPDYVREEWPSPQQFNHAIVAIAYSSDKTIASGLKHPVLGDLMIFDPTDPETAVGEIPDHEQGSLALIVAGDSGGIVRMPDTSPESNRLEREVVATLAPDGSLVGAIYEKSIGQAATTGRREFRGLSRADYDKMIESWVAGSVTGAKVSNIVASDDPVAGTFTFQADIAAARYGQLMQNRLLVFKPVIVSRRASIFLTDSQRTLPIMIRSQAYTETVRIKLPAGFQVDELPDPVKLETSFGSYFANYKVDGNDLVLTRLLTLQRSTLPASQYGVVRSFYERILAAEQAPAVLMKK